MLKHIDISELGLDKRMVRIILKSLKKNVNLKSINFGHIAAEQIRELIEETAIAPDLRFQSGTNCQIERPAAEINSQQSNGEACSPFIFKTTQRPGEDDMDIAFRTLLVNAGLRAN